MSSTEKPEGFETKSVPGYVPSQPYTRDEVAQGDKPGISNTPGNDTWTGNGEDDKEFGAQSQEQSETTEKTGDASGASTSGSSKRGGSSAKSTAGSDKS